MRNYQLDAPLRFNRVIFGLPSAEKDTVVPMLDRYAEIVSAIQG